MIYSDIIASYICEVSNAICLLNYNDYNIDSIISHAHVTYSVDRTPPTMHTGGNRST